MRLASAQAEGSSERVTGGLGRLHKKDRALKGRLKNALRYNKRASLSGLRPFYEVYPGLRSLFQSSLLPGLEQAAFSMLYSLTSAIVLVVVS